MQIPAARIVFPDEDRTELLKKIDGILQTGQLTLGPYTREFEEKFSQQAGTKYAVAVNSGTSALEIILRSLDITDGSVVVPTNTFFATAAAVVHAGSRVIFADINDDLCIDPESVRNSIKKDTRAVIAVHIGGVISPDIREIQRICRENDIYLIEDAAHAHESTLDGEKAGSFGIAAAFSFYPTKVMTSGEGGMIITNSEDVYQRAQVFRDQGKAGFLGNIHTEMGYNWRMSEIHAVIGLSQLNNLDSFIENRRMAAAVYDEELKSIEQIEPLVLPDGVFSNYYKYVAFLPEGTDRTSLKKAMREKYQVGLSGEVYELPCHLQPVFKDMYGFKGGEFPVAEDLCNRQICLPVFAGMTEEQARYVISSLKEVL